MNIWQHRTTGGFQLLPPQRARGLLQVKGTTNTSKWPWSSVCGSDYCSLCFSPNTTHLRVAFSLVLASRAAGRAAMFAACVHTAQCKVRDVRAGCHVMLNALQLCADGFAGLLQFCWCVRTNMANDLLDKVWRGDCTRFRSLLWRSEEVYVCRLQGSGVWISWASLRAQTKQSGDSMGGHVHLIVGNPLGLGDELSAAHFAVAVCEKPLVHFRWLHLERETNADTVTDLDAGGGRRTEPATHFKMCSLNDLACKVRQNVFH